MKLTGTQRRQRDELFNQLLTARQAGNHKAENALLLQIQNRVWLR